MKKKYINVNWRTSLATKLTNLYLTNLTSLYLANLTN